MKINGNKPKEKNTMKEKKKKNEKKKNEKDYKWLRQDLNLHPNFLERK